MRSASLPPSEPITLLVFGRSHLRTRVVRGRIDRSVGTRRDGDPALEEKIKQDHAVTGRCIPLDNRRLRVDEGASGSGPFTGDKNAKRMVWAKSCCHRSPSSSLGRC